MQPFLFCRLLTAENYLIFISLLTEQFFTFHFLRV